MAATRGKYYDSAPLSGPALAAYQQAGRAWVAVSSEDLPIGFIVVDLVDGRAHVEQVSVHPDQTVRPGRPGRRADQPCRPLAL